jgi:hypothetical protein
MRAAPAWEYTVTASIVQHVHTFRQLREYRNRRVSLAIPNYRQQKKQREQAKKKKKDEKLLRKGKAPVLNEPEQPK